MMADEIAFRGRMRIDEQEFDDFCAARGWTRLIPEQQREAAQHFVPGYVQVQTATAMKTQEES